MATKKKESPKKKKEKKPNGRPPVYSRKIADEICQRLASGLSLRAICRGELMPSRQTVNQWIIDDHDGFSDRYVRARDIGLDEMADETIDISDYGINDTYLDDEGNKRIDHDVIARSKLRVDTRKWYLSKLASKRYGEKVEVEQKVSGSIQVIKRVVVDPKNDK